ncbi:hypothetical protein [Roseococcus suduntuyensis]|uniref:hypothetical protein n=1 Tax=Roseococcus suduntuyensis TaxID=455361 RepID=UPI001610B77D|nr:hypothetical protein [Roseococcus suduntuyensis]
MNSSESLNALAQRRLRLAIVISAMAFIALLKLQLPAGPEPALEEFLMPWMPQDTRDPRAGMVACC